MRREEGLRFFWCVQLGDGGLSSLPFPLHEISQNVKLLVHRSCIPGDHMVPKALRRNVRARSYNPKMPS